MPQIAFIVPAYNEAGSLPAVVADLRAHVPTADIVVINDGSSDDTALIARELGVILLDLPCNLGIGGCVQTGLLFAERRGYDVAVQFDGDGQHRADQVEKLIGPILRDEADVVVGSRFLEGTDYRPSMARRLGIFIFRVVNSLLVRRKLTDNTSGFRAYNKRATRHLAADYPHDYPEPESLVDLCRAGFRVSEVGILMRERQAGQSSITLWRSIYYMIKVLTATIIGATRMKPSSS